MELGLRATGVEESDAIFRDLAGCVEESNSLYDLVKLWMQQGRSMACMRSDDASDHMVGISFDQDRLGLAVGLLSSAEIFRAIPHLAVIPGDHDDAKLDEFVAERNERLGIEFSEETSKFMAPSSALEELVYSYALAEKGFGQVELVDIGGQLYLELFLVILNRAGDPDWGEMIYIDMASTSVIQ